MRSQYGTTRWSQYETTRWSRGHRGRPTIGILRTTAGVSGDQILAKTPGWFKGRPDIGSVSDQTVSPETARQLR